MNWIYNGCEIDNIDKFPKGAFGFIYKITNICDYSEKYNHFYIGRKNLYSERNKPLTKKELVEQALIKKPGKKPTKKLVRTESDWLKYYGSEPTIKQLVKDLGYIFFKREILHVTFSKKETSYRELNYLMKYDVLEDPLSMNSNVEGRYFRSDFR